MGRAALTAQSESRAQQMRVQACGAAGKGLDEVRQPFGEEFAPTPAHAAHKAADVEMQDDRSPAQGRSASVRVYWECGRRERRWQSGLRPQRRVATTSR